MARLARSGRLCDIEGIFGHLVKGEYSMTIRKALGISPMIDMAFKKSFATPGNEVALISLLNAFLKLAVPIVDVTVVNPYNLQDFETDKLSILDIKATDTRKTVYHIEMQLTMYRGMVQRIAFYGCELYAGADS